MELFGNFIDIICSDRVIKTVDGWQHYVMTVTLDLPAGPLTTEYRQGMAHKVEPTAEEVMYSLTTDAQMAGESFEDWCDSFGYDSDSRKAWAIYEQCQSTRDQLELSFKMDELTEYFQDY